MGDCILKYLKIKLFYILPDISLVYILDYFPNDRKPIYSLPGIFPVIGNLSLLSSLIPNFLASEIRPYFWNSSLPRAGAVPSVKVWMAWERLISAPSLPLVCTWWKTSVPCKNSPKFCFPVSSWNVVANTQEFACKHAQKQKRTGRT